MIYYINFLSFIILLLLMQRWLHFSLLNKSRYILMPFSVDMEQDIIYYILSYAMSEFRFTTFIIIQCKYPFEKEAFYYFYASHVLY